MSSEHPSISESSQVKLTLQRAAIIAAGLFSGGAVAGIAYNELQKSVAALDIRVAEMAKVVARLDAPSIRDMCRALVKEEMRTIVVQCPKQVRRGEAVGPCKVVTPERSNE